MLLWDCYSQILWPRRHLPKLADGLCRNSDIRICLDPHVIWQPTKSYVERCNAFRLISHRCLPFFIGDHHEPASDIDTAVVDGLKAIDPTRPIREADIEAPPPDVRFTPKAAITECGLECPLCVGFRRTAPRNMVSSTDQVPNLGNGPRPRI
jgi:hypothetical protein